MGKTIYLAGKIGKNDWRHKIVDGLRDAVNHPALPYKWPVLRNAIFNRFDYIGPFFVACDHGCYHGRNEHGCGVRSIVDGYDEGRCQADNLSASTYHNPTNGALLHMEVADACLAAIRKCDFFFAWIDSRDCYGTLVEIGYAMGLNKPVYIGSPYALGPLVREVDYDNKIVEEYNDLWFVFSAPIGRVLIGDNPTDTLRFSLLLSGAFFDSPMEHKFWLSWTTDAQTRMIELQPQHIVCNGKYRLDFAHIPTKTAIEIDGFTYHSDKAAFQRDRQRDRDLTALGWRVIRFSSQEIEHDIDACVRQAASIIKSHME